jgi:acyl-CoA thioesterase-2
MNTCEENNVLEELLRLLKLEKIEETIFRGDSQDLGFDSVFGGQVLGQALSAAYQTIQSDRKAHSLHAYFLRMGDANRPIIYEVDCIRDGKSFTTRRVVAIQKGRAIFSMSASFQIDEPGFDHQDKAPEVIGPEGIKSELELAMAVADKIPSSIREKILCKKPIEFRPVNPIDPFFPKKREPVGYKWFKAIDKMPDDFRVHQYLLAYASDFGLVSTSLYPHEHNYWEQDMQVASLDHALWFHRDFRMDEWLLYVMESPNAYKAKGLNNGRIYTKKGKLVASVSQEGLIRNHAMKKRFV